MMNQNDIRQKIVDKLLEMDSKFRKDYESHRELDRIAGELTEQTVRTPDDDQRLKEIKIRKLTLKDRIEKRIHALIQSDTLQ